VERGRRDRGGVESREQREQTGWGRWWLKKAADEWVPHGRSEYTNKIRGYMRVGLELEGKYKSYM
jgi:hypothetical protein